MHIRPFHLCIKSFTDWVISLAAKIMCFFFCHIISFVNIIWKQFEEPNLTNSILFDYKELWFTKKRKILVLFFATICKIQ